MSRYLAKNLNGKQKDWTVATQKRIAMTISILASIKSLKRLGITSYTESLVHNLRVQELSGAVDDGCLQCKRCVPRIFFLWLISDFCSKCSQNIFPNHHIRALCLCIQLERFST